MNLMIKIIFYLKGGNVVEEGIEYAKAEETTTEEEFQKDVMRIADETKIGISEGMVTDGGKIFQFGNTIVRFADISAYQISLEKIETNGFNISESEENEPYIYMNESEESVE